MAEVPFPGARAVWVAGAAHPACLPRACGALSWHLPPTGSIPGPIAFGSVIDRACLLWQDQCGQQGACFVYQNAAMSQYMLVAGVAYKVSGGGPARPRDAPTGRPPL